VLSKKDALDAAQYIMNGPRADEAGRLNLIAASLKPRTPTVTLPREATPTMARLAAKSQTNYLPLVLDTLAQVMKVEGYRAKGASDNAKPWANWQRNSLDARQSGITRSALAYGASYATILPGDTGPVITGVSARAMTALYQDPSRDDWPMLALQVDGNLVKLFDEEQVYYLGQQNDPRSGLVAPLLQSRGLEFIEARPHGMPFCPVARFRDRMLLEGEEQYGIIEPIITIQHRIDETTFGMMVAQFFSAFRQRYIIGWMPESEAEELKASASQLWTFSSENVKAGDFAETDLTRYLESKNSGVRDMAAISQVPAQSLGVDGINNVSAEALASLEAGKDRKADEITTSLGETWELVLRAAAYIEGDEESAADFSAQIRWKNATARSLAQTVDALGKMAQMLGVPVEAVWERIPDVSETDIINWKRLRKESQAGLGDLTAMFSPPAG
jgi:hypothetical protein